ncbi:MAG: hypothetical protein E5V92_01915 [Mesorhizobium sp.]|uniref:hypothetical protein n=1 Tax=unclassified Mesorhizobium TaxID=325217 RepID=UPI000F74D668|nr:MULTISPECIES: hypothetical protein [unclassified Mesorhizobium]AZO75029.1 hypothetical protein EJ067_30545 [Mesorhizobium sp. M1D.F.Ca.ET.043.01.1.1]RWA96100.1 MAG: hypothetical protein EOQ32_00330 [Mesorhizobium sp.]TJW90380.1 MAG: hypothetical protein E5V92_01915 [Mesorhizobium sp.]
MSGETANLEVWHRDANHALFMVLIECCQIIIDTADESDAMVAIVARNIKQSGKTKMANKEIAECAYRLALGLKQWKHPQAEALARLVAQIMLADRWEAKLR